MDIDKLVEIKKLLLKIYIIFIFSLIVFTTSCSDLVDIDENSGKSKGFDYDTPIESVNQWEIGSKLKGKYIDDKSIKIVWDIDEEQKKNIYGYRIYRRAWEEDKYSLVKKLPATDTIYIDLLPENQNKSVCFYTIYVDFKDIKQPVQSSSITVWKLKDFHLKTTAFKLDKTNFWISNQPGNSLSKESRFCLTDILKWEELANKTYGFLLYRNSLINASFKDLDALLAAKASNGIKIGIETSGFQNVSSTEKSVLGEKSYESEMKALSNLTSKKGKIDYVFFDGPIHSALYPGGTTTSRMTLSEAAKELTDLMLLYRNYNPDIKFYLISNFSNWGWNGKPARNSKGIGIMGYGDYKTVLDSVLDLADQRGVKFNGVSIDFSYEAYLNEGSSDQIEVVKNIDYKIRLKELYTYLREKGYGVSVSLNNNRGGNSSSNIFRIETINYLEEMLRSDILPDLILHQTWNPYPDIWLPETVENSFTYTGLELVRKYGIRK
jgi:hypothetical protein